MEDTTTKKTPQQPKKLTDLQEEIIAAQSKTINVLEENIKLLREHIELKEKMSKLGIENNG
jgi:hypothetical protein